MDLSGGRLGLLIQAAQKEILESYRKEFDQLTAAFRDLDGKAQGTATVAGALLAASLAYLNRPGSLSTPAVRVIMIFAILGLMGAIAFAIRALSIRTLVNAPSGEDVETLLISLGKDVTPEELEQRLTYFCGDAARLWRKCITDRRSINEEKADHIWSAQKGLMLTALAISGLILLTILGSSGG